MQVKVSAYIRGFLHFCLSDQTGKYEPYLIQSTFIRLRLPVRWQSCFDRLFTSCPSASLCNHAQSESNRSHFDPYLISTFEQRFL